MTKPAGAKPAGFLVRGGAADRGKKAARALTYHFNVNAPSGSLSELV